MMVDDSRTMEAIVDDHLCDDDSTRMINSTSTISDRVLVGDKCSSSGVHEDFSCVDGKRTVQATLVAEAMVDDSRTTEAMVDDRLCDNESTRTINSTSTISDRAGIFVLNLLNFGCAERLIFL